MFDHKGVNRQWLGPGRVAQYVHDGIARRAAVALDLLDRHRARLYDMYPHGASP
jgi:hypothetical protein